MQIDVEITQVLRMNDGGGQTTPDQLAVVAASLINAPTAHSWLISSSTRSANIRSGDVAPNTVAAPEG